MRGGRGYYPRGSGNRRGGGTSYRSSNNYGDRVNSRMGGRYENNYNGGGTSNRYHSNNYDSRNRDNFNSGGRRDGGTKRSYPDSSRDRSGDRKHSRTDDYRRSSLGHTNRTPPPPPPPQLGGSTSESRNYRGSNSAINSYRSGGGERVHSSTNRHRSPPTKRPMRSGLVISRPRGVLSSASRGIRTSVRGNLRNHAMNRESVDLKIMRRKLFYAQQKDRQRVMKIARLTSSLRRRRLGRRSKSPRHSRSEKKTSGSDEEADEDKEKNGDESHDAEENDGNDHGASEKSNAEEVAGEKKKSSGKSATKRTAKSMENDDAESSGGGKSKTTIKIGDNDEEETEDTENKIKHDDEDSSAADAENEKKTDIPEQGGSSSKTSTSKVKENGESIKKESKKGEKESSRKDKEPRKSSSKKDDNKKHKETSSSKDDKKDKDKERSKDKKSSSSHSYSRRDDHSNSMRSSSRFIKLTCVHCNAKCVTFKEYSQHLHLGRHKTAIRQVAMRQRAYLMRLRMTQRTAQREIEGKSKEEYEPKFCHLCRLNYRQPKAKHQLSEHHKTIKKFLMPYCSTCHLAFKSPMLYETHRCSLEHIRNKARKNDSDSDQSGDDMREIDLKKYMTVDSVGEIDDDLCVDADEIDMDMMDDTFDESHNDGGDIDEDEANNKTPVGAKFIKKIECFFCSLCNNYSPIGGVTIRTFSKKHCLLRAHLKAFLAHKSAEEAAKLKKDEEEAAAAAAAAAAAVAAAAAAAPNAGSDDVAAGGQEQNEIEADDDVVIIKTEKEDTNDKSVTEENGNDATADDDVDMSGHAMDDEELWNDVDKDLGELLAEVEPNSNVDGEEDEDESVLNIDIESEKPKSKEMNGKKEPVSVPAPAPTPTPVAASSTASTPTLTLKQTPTPAPAPAPAPTTAAIKKVASTTAKSTPNKPKPQRKAATVAANKLSDSKEKVAAK